ncbi:hypothetical protein OG943_09170 [Amycolatopsis sp. NBC_00345]|uniref:hypothetical protein n=1 Tax=Amycolatopsis sp. NBC_00345 TaxID=2975955 RepID=UPI002E25B7EA
MNRMSWAVPALVLAAAGLAGCGTAVPGLAAPASQPAAGQEIAPTTVTAPAPVTVTAPPPPVVVVQPQTTVIRPPPAAPASTPCQRLLADGYSYSDAYSAWAKAGYPLSWDADRDGYPCEQSYGNRN